MIKKNINDLIKLREDEAKRAWREHSLAIERCVDNPTEDASYEDMINIMALEREYLSLLASLEFIQMMNDEVKFIAEVEMNKNLKVPPKALIDDELEYRFRLNTKLLKDYLIDISYKLLSARPGLYKGEEIKLFLVTLKPIVPNRIVSVGG